MRLTLTEELEKLEKKQSEEIARLKLTHTILDALHEDLRAFEPRVFVHDLYGRVASLTFSYDFFRYSSNANKPQPTLDTVQRLAETFPYHKPLTLVEDGCVSVRPTFNVDTIPEERRERMVLTEIAPFEVQVGSFQKTSATFSWHADVAGKVVEMVVELPPMRELGTLDVKYQHKPDDCGCRGRVIRNHFQPDEHLVYLRDEAGLPIATIHRTINYGGGSPDTPGDKLLLWTPLGSAPVRIEDLIRTLKENK